LVGTNHISGSAEDRVASAGQLDSARASARGPRAGRFVRFWASVGAKFTKMGDYLPWTPMNRRTKFDAASFIPGGEIRNRTNKNTQTVTGISRACLSACVDNKSLSYCKVRATRFVS